MTSRALRERVEQYAIRQEMDTEPIARREPWRGLHSETARRRRSEAVEAAERLAELERLATLARRIA